jgi:hypothetical protein
MNSADLRGTVTDSTGALIPGVKVSVLNVETGVVTTVETNGSGIYETSSIVSGHYKVTYTKSGFESYVRGPITLQTGYTTVNAQLKIGSTTQEVTVTADVPLLQQDSGEQTQTWDSHTLDLMPQVAASYGQGQDWENEMAFLPGMSGNPTTSYGVTGLGQFGSANGSQASNNILLDGSSTSLGGSTYANPATLEAIGELQVSLSSFSAQYGQGGAIINQITKGGTNHFHGAAYDYMLNDKMNANNYGFNSQPTVPFIRFHNFGGIIGGPIIKKKMFFNFDYDQVIDHGSASNATNTIPTSDLMTGDFSNIIPTIYDPLTQQIGLDSANNIYPIRASFADEYGNGNKIPSSVIDSVANAAQAYYPTQSNHLSGGKFVQPTINNLGIQTQNFYTTLPQSTPYVKYFGRFDYDITEKNRLSMTDSKNDSPVIYPSTVTECPLGCEAGDVDNVNAQITDVWTINPHLINEARYGFTWQGNWFSDLALGHDYANKLNWQFAKADDFPGIGLVNFAGMGPASNATGVENVFDPSDVVTLIAGKHILHFGGEFLAYRINYTAWGNINAGSFSFNGSYTQQWQTNGQGIASANASTGLDYADFLLGTASAWSAGFYPEYGMRLKSPQVFIQDDWKIRPNLTINIGLRYQGNYDSKEVHGNVSSFDPTVNNPATNTLGAMWYGVTAANGRKNLEANVFSTFLPRVGFAWSPDSKTTFHGGFGMYTYNWTLDAYSGISYSGPGSAFNSTGTTADQTGGIIPLVKLNGAGTVFNVPTSACNTAGCGLQTTSTPLPYVNASTTPDAYNGQSVGYYQYHTPVPKSMQWNLTMQHTLGNNMVAEIAYVGSHGYDLVNFVDLNQVPKSQLGPNASQYTPYPNYVAIAGSTNNAISNYHSLQVVFTKRMSNGLSLNANYVWSHFLDEQDQGGSGRSGGSRPFVNAYDPRSTYSNSNFDTRNALKIYGDYELPFGKGKQFLNKNAILDSVIGGWDIAFAQLLLSGTPFNVYMPCSADQSNNGMACVDGNYTSFPDWVPGVSARVTNRGIHDWYNPAAFQAPQPYTYGNVRRNSLYGPGINATNLSMSKTFSLPWENLKLKVRADATNAFNHASFGQPQNEWTGPTTDTGIYSVQVGGRQMQLGAHLSF